MKYLLLAAAIFASSSVLSAEAPSDFNEHGNWVSFKHKTEGGTFYVAVVQEKEQSQTWFRFFRQKDSCDSFISQVRIDTATLKKRLRVFLKANKFSRIQVLFGIGKDDFINVESFNLKDVGDDIMQLNLNFGKSKDIFLHKLETESQFVVTFLGGDSLEMFSFPMEGSDLALAKIKEMCAKGM